jgi:hypothetical protein
VSARLQFRPGAIWSLWDIMKAFNAGPFFSIGVMIELASGTLEGEHTKAQIDRYLKNIKSRLEEIRIRLEEVSASLSIKSVDRIIENIEAGTTANLVSTRLDALAERIRDELDSMYFLQLSASQAEQLNAKDHPFGVEVASNFASASEDIYEAVKCLALERPTACVMHLMRATEAPLKALGAALGVGEQVDWGGYIREIDRALGERLKAAGKRSVEEKFYADASVEFAHVKRAWRNPSTHIDRTYTLERATEILAATRSLMRHLASRLTEWSVP